MDQTTQYTGFPVRTADTVLIGHGLTKTYGPTLALGGVDIAVLRGESVAVMGTSGSGKTTLLHCLAGILVPDAGTVTLHADGAPVAVHSLSPGGRAALRRERYGFVFQQGLLLPELTALENVALPLLLNGTARREAETQAGRWLDWLGLEGMGQRRPGQLSGGQQQRVAVARAQVAAPPVVFADEPTGALDSATSEETMTALLAATTGRGGTLVLVTHDESVARRCDRVVRLHDGQVAHDGPTAHERPVPGAAPTGTQVSR
ncbi:ABC transporter ATP-binding protein [Georgenia halophila]